jgi:cell division transport system permease protein
MRPRIPFSLKRLTEISLKNISRNLLLSVATTVMMGLILFIFNVIIVLNVLTDSSLDALGEKVDLILYVSDDASVYEITEVINEVESLPVVESVTYTSKEAALSEFLDLYPDKSDPFTVYEIENPLPANIQVITSEPSQHSMVTDYLDSSVYSELLINIESSDENQEIIARLLSVTNFTEKLIIGVIITFIFGSLLMIMNAIHLSIFTRKTEIQIMQLVGAKPHMIRFPFLFEGAFYSLIAVFFSFFLLLLFVEGTNLSSFANFQESFNPMLLFAIELVASILIGMTSSYVAITYYLKRTLILQK